MLTCCECGQPLKVKVSKTGCCGICLKTNRQKYIKSSNGAIKARENGREFVVSEITRQKLSRATSGRRHSQRTKENLSRTRKAYLAAHPDKVPYRLNHYSKGPSVPEQYFATVFESRGLLFETQKQIGLYNLDFAFANMRAVEIDGEQHYVDRRIVIHDEKRTNVLAQLGWSIKRVRWSEYQKKTLIERQQYCDELIRWIVGVFERDSGA